ncbi:MAG: ABC transporter ATP-binding protein [Candidatus Verstraetearchaeota archaeon]|nr:ABC transporter ATP-binding protein [Candidatus Verstraetearchaeota archaeon]
MPPVVVLKDLVKEYSKRRAVDGVSLEIGEGEIFGLIGPNGAGKTTTLRMIATIIKPTSGEVVVCGRDAVREASAVRKLISYLPEEAGAYPNLSGKEYLKFMASFYYEREEDAATAVEEGERISGLGDRLKERSSAYSKGMKRRLQLARALMVKPKLAILDEPTSGLDVTHAFHLRRIIKEYAERHGITVLLSSHNMLEVQNLCDRVAFMNEGRVVEIGPPGGLMAKYGVATLEEAFMKVVGFA